MDFAPIQTDIAQLQMTHYLGYQQNLDKQFFQLGQRLLTEAGNRVMVGSPPRGSPCPEGYPLPCGVRPGETIRPGTAPQGEAS